MFEDIGLPDACVLREPPARPLHAFRRSHAGFPLPCRRVCVCRVSGDRAWSQMAMRANSLTAENKRRTLQRNDIAMAVSKTDTYDFLIDIVPREEVMKLALALWWYNMEPG